MRASCCCRRRSAGLGALSIPVPPPAVTITGDLLRRAKLVDVSPEQIRFLEHGRVADVSRLPIVFGYQPKYTTLQAFDDWVASAGLRLIDPEAVVHRRADRLRAAAAWACSSWSG